MRVVVTQPAEWHSDGDRNFDAVLRDAERSRIRFGPDDVVVLPELAGAELGDRRYRRRVEGLARSLGSWVVGGSHHCASGSGTVNRGAVADPGGSVVADYEKLNPYGDERAAGVLGGSRPRAVEVGGHRLLVLLCADFWYFDSLAAESGPDLVIVPAFSVTQRPSPAIARSLWRHMAVSRAYEVTAFVAISDWAHPSAYRGRTGCGVAGFADPNPATSRGLFRGLGNRRLAAFEPDFAALTDLRDNRRNRNFAAVRSRPVA
ncbi:carbon-nitrogen hydrolase family protein [Microbispora sp. GKU 823]|uniref:carbon-nitrogen hydrolase family protein n=1 Tax=Microbispora sp. GKU 823 TaxID=1652100 RepID=UPI0015C44A13|nr:carbon-nitrogen hydrolase family protein [Microbispora sp. GKU 823]